MNDTNDLVDRIHRGLQEFHRKAFKRRMDMYTQSHQYTQVDITHQIEYLESLKMNKFKLPKVVMRLTHNFDAWIVGGAAAPIPKEGCDIDVLIPFHRWHEASIITNDIDITINSFGGYRFESEGKSIDMWPGDLSWILQRPKLKYAWHPASGRRFGIIENE